MAVPAQSGLGAIAAADSTRATLELLLRLCRPGDPVVSADGERVAFTVVAACSEPNRRRESRIWVASGGAAEEVTRGPVDEFPRWSPDGRTLAFASDRAEPGRGSVHLLREGSGEEAVPGAPPGSVEDLEWLGDERLIVLVTESEGERERQDPRVVRPGAPLRRLHVLDLDAARSTPVAAEVTVWEFAPRGCAEAVAVVSRDRSESGWYGASLALLDLETGAASTLYTPAWQIAAPRISPHGELVAFVEGICSDRGDVVGTVTVVARGSGVVTRPAPELDVSDLRWRDDRSLFYAGWRGLGAICGVLGLDGTRQELWSGEASLGAGRPAISNDAGGRVLVASRESLQEPPEVALLEVERPEAGWRTLSSLNAEVASQIPIPIWERRTWRSGDGLEIEGLVALPREQQTGPLPLVVLVHGGPTAAWTYRFAHTYGQPTLLAGAGFAVLLPNPRGSTGRGQDFARTNVGDLGGRELDDILAGVDACIEAGIADRARVGISGGSHGGYIAAWAPTQSDRFAASVPWACVSDLVSAHYGSNIAGFDDVFFGARPHQVPDAFVQRSPVIHARKCNAPTLIIHGERDPYCPIGQAEELFGALVEAGVEVELVVYPREGHGWSERAHMIDFWERVHAWFERHLRGGEESAASI